MSFLLIMTFLLNGCYHITKPVNRGYIYTPLTKKAKIKHKLVNFSENETKYLQYGNYIKTQIDDNNFIYRQFFDKQLIEYRRIKIQPNKKIKTVQKRWYDNGLLWDEGTFINGVKEGEWVVNSHHKKDTLHTIKTISNYKNGLKNGKEVVYFGDGTTKAIFNYENNLKYGEFITYDSLGVELCNGIFKLDSMFENSCDAKNQYNQNLEMAIFPGGETALLTYLYSNIKYPSYAKQNDIQGVCLTKFIVNEVGNIEDIKVIRTIDNSIKNVVVPIIETMPQWIPGEKDGLPAKTYYTLPVKFKLE